MIALNGANPSKMQLRKVTGQKNSSPFHKLAVNVRPIPSGKLCLRRAWIRRQWEWKINMICRFSWLFIFYELIFYIEPWGNSVPADQNDFRKAKRADEGRKREGPK
jgi:hypothetical protein